MAAIYLFSEALSPHQVIALALVTPMMTMVMTCYIITMSSCNDHQLTSNLKVCAMHRLGPGYKNQFKFETEAGQTLSETHRKV